MAEPTSRTDFAAMLETHLPTSTDIGENDAGLEATETHEPMFTRPAYNIDREAFTLTEQ